MIRKACIFIATGAYSGLTPYAPGTAGSIAGLFLYFLLLDDLPYPVQAALILLTVLVGVKTAGVAEAHFNKKDPKEVVIDEISGIWVALFMVPLEINYTIAAFALFRLFDILKPGIKWAEKIHGGWGIMLDDLLAGLAANLLLQAALYLL